MIDLRSTNVGQQQVEVMWSAVMNGLLNGVITPDRVTDGINQAFEQSPYVQSQ